MEATLDDTATNGGSNNRQVAPAGISVSSAAKNCANSGTIADGSYQSLWMKLSLPAGSAAIKNIYVPQIQGNTT